MENILLYPVQESKDLLKMMEIQKEAFKRLYLKYRDTETSPYKETLQDIERKFAMANSRYYLIQVNFINVGFIRIITDTNKSVARISPIAILPQFENNGYGKRAICEIENRFPTIKEWNVDIVKQETKLINFYLDLGYVYLDKEDIIHEGMYISCFKKTFNSNLSHFLLGIFKNLGGGGTLVKKPNYNNSIENNKRNEFKANIKKHFKAKLEQMLKENLRVVPKVAIIFSSANIIGQYLVNREIDLKSVLLSAAMFAVLALLGFFSKSSKKEKTKIEQ